jgi:hypothetical protein
MISPRREIISPGRNHLSGEKSSLRRDDFSPEKRHFLDKMGLTTRMNPTTLNQYFSRIRLEIRPDQIK